MLAHVSYRVNARGKVADDEIEVIQAGGLGLGDGGDGLVGAEHHGEAFGAFAVLHLGDQGGRVGGRGQRHVVGVDVLDGTRNFGVRAHGEGAQVGLTLRGPLAQRLGQQRNRGHQEQDFGCAAECFGDAFADLQCGERLAGAAGHDQLAAVMVAEPGDHLLDGHPLVWPGVALGRGGQVEIEGFGRAGERPVDRGLGDVG